MTSPDTDPNGITSGSMPGAYDPGAVESGWYRRWLDADLFRADPESPKPAFSIASRLPTSPAICTWATPSRWRCRTRGPATGG